MNPQSVLQNAPVYIRSSLSDPASVVSNASEAWRRKMALLETIHTEISPQLEVMMANEDDDFIPTVVRGGQ